MIRLRTQVYMQTDVLAKVEQIYDTEVILQSLCQDIPNFSKIEDGGVNILIFGGDLIRNDSIVC